MGKNLIKKNVIIIVSKKIMKLLKGREGER